jgi:choline dehydrogenase-like flavoprotein
MLANEFIRLPIQAINLPPKGTPRWGRAHKEFMRRAYRRTIRVQGPVQEIPVFDSRVQVDLKVKDYWGLPVARLSGDKHPHNLEIAKFLSDKAERWLKAAAAVSTWQTVPGRGLSAGQHQAGTCRMGDDPKTSVVNRFCQVHEVDNVFVVDGSVHVTNGGFNPVLTIMAIAYYASGQIVKTWKGTGFRS